MNKALRTKLISAEVRENLLLTICLIIHLENFLFISLILMILVHIADLTNSVTQYDIEKVFMKYGEIKEVWMAKNPPCFAFVVFKNKEDAAEACKDMDQK